MNLDALSTSQFASLLDVDDTTVRNWIRNNGLPATHAGRGRVIAWRAGLSWWLTYRESASGNSGKTGKKVPDEVAENYEEALARKTRAEADLKELQLAEMRGLVASLEDVEKVITAANLATRTQIEAVPARLALQLVGVPDRNTAFQIINRETSQLMTNLSTIGDILAERGPVTEGSED